jgi:hypothetical protein
VKSIGGHEIPEYALLERSLVGDKEIHSRKLTETKNYTNAVSIMTNSAAQNG